MIHLSSILVYSWIDIDITEINFHQFFSTYFTKHVQTHNYPTRNAQDYSINKTKKMFSDCAIRNCGPTFWNSLDKTVKHCKTTKHFRNQLKSTLLLVSEYNWLHFGACLVYFCVLCLFVKLFCKFLYIFVETFVKGMIFLRPSWSFDHVLNIMLWLCFLCLFILMYDIGIKFDMIWYMIWIKKKDLYDSQRAKWKSKLIPYIMYMSLP